MTGHQYPEDIMCTRSLINAAPVGLNDRGSVRTSLGGRS